MERVNQVLLDEADIQALTGYARPSDQRRWLDEAGVGYLVRANGRISTTWAAVNAVLIGSVVVAKPNFSELR